MTKQYKTSSELKNAAKDSLTGKYGSSILIIFLSGLISFAAAFFISQLSVMTELSIYGISGQSNISVVSVIFFLISLVTSIVLGLLELGVNLFFLNIACGQTASISNLFYGFRTQSNKALAVSAAIVLLNNVCLTPYQEFMIQYLNTLQEKWLAAMLVSAVIGMIIYVPLSLSLSQSFYLLLDFPDRKARDILKLSMRLMKGQKRRLFYIQASFIPLMLLCVLTLGIGFLWLYPYMQMTYTHFFLDLMRAHSQKAQ